MIQGTVSSDHEMVVPLFLRDSAGNEHEIETVLDTGFNGFLSYKATVIWDGAPRAIVVHAMDNDPLLGMRLLVGHDMSARVKFGGGVRIEAIP